MTKQMIQEKKFRFWLPVLRICRWEGSQMWIFFLCSNFSSCVFNRLVANARPATAAKEAPLISDFAKALLLLTAC